MANEIIINSHPLERRVAILENNRLVELLVEKREQENIVGNIYKGIVKDILPGMGAAFVDIGVERTAFIHYSDIVTDFLDEFESNKKKLTQINKDSSKIGNYLKQGQEIIVQIQKGPIGKKGARLTGQISIPGKYIVFFPNKKKVAISKKIRNQEERKRIRDLLYSIKAENIGLIVRTAAENVSDEELTLELKKAQNSWRLIEKQIRYAKAPACIFDDNDLFNVLIRDLFNENMDRLVVDDKKLKTEIQTKVKVIAPDLAHRIEYYTEDSPVFDAYGIEKEIETLFKSRIGLPSGGNIVIEQTEALVAIDINTGRFTGNKNYEETVRRTNIEAAREIARQVRLRDLSGIVVVDFIDMREDASRQAVLDALRKELKSDRARNKVFPFGPLGLVEITRKRTRMNMITAHSEHCPHCNGTGRVLSRDAVAMRIYRWLQRAEYFIQNRPLRIAMHPNVKEFVFINPKYLKAVPNTIEIQEDKSLRQDEFRIIDAETEKDLTKRYNA